MVSQLTGSTWLHFRSFRSCHLMLTCHRHILSRAWLPSRDQVAWQKWRLACMRETLETNFGFAEEGFI